MTDPGRRNRNLGLQRRWGLAIVPPQLPTSDVRSTGARGQTALTWKVRTALGVLAIGLASVFVIAAFLDPYYEDGKPRIDETHRQLGLPECTFKTLTGKPCPSCGMTTSFALLLRGDVPNSVRANAVGSLLAVFLVLLIPWAVASVVRGRLLYIASFERALTWTVAVFLMLLVVRWGIILLQTR